MSEGKMVIVIPKGGHLADCVREIINGEVDTEKHLQFVERYSSEMTLAYVPAPPTEREIKEMRRKFFQDFKDLPRMTEVEKKAAREWLEERENEPSE